jgi:ring-1,2-phenylacetyl-CoA epoxidase subunit PaaC
MQNDKSILEYVLRLGDNCLILSQRLGEWCGHGPILEEDIALTNFALDLLGHARFWLSYAAELEGAGRDEDQLAFLRDSGEFRNLLLVEQENGDFAETIARQFYFDTWYFAMLDKLRSSTDARICAIAEKAVKEVKYHLQRSTDWVIRLGDGTAESKRRMQSAIDRLWMYTGEMFEMDSVDQEMLNCGVGVDLSAIRDRWMEHVGKVLDQATLTMPAATWMQRGGKQGIHTERLGYILSEMQTIQRSYPGLQW